MKNLLKKETMPYDVSNNLQLLAWINAAIRRGYDFNLGFSDLQDIIDRLTLCYEMQYPDGFLEMDIQEDFDWVPTIANYLNAFPKDEKAFLKNNYRTLDKVIIDNKYYNVVSLINKSNKDREVICFDGETGILLKDYCTNLFNSNVETIDDFYLYALIDRTQYDVSELEHCLNNHEFDKMLRSKILRLAVNKMINSKNTTKEEGIKRSNIFISDVNNLFGDVLSESKEDTEPSRNNVPRKRVIKRIKD